MSDQRRAIPRYNSAGRWTLIPDARHPWDPAFLSARPTRRFRRSKDSPPKAALFSAAKSETAPLAYYNGESDAATRRLLDFDLRTDASLRIIVHPQGGDIDIALRREDGSLVDFSNYRGAATEIIEATGMPGRYRLEILVNEKVAGFDITHRRAPTSWRGSRRRTRSRSTSTRGFSWPPSSSTSAISSAPRSRSR